MLEKLVKWLGEHVGWMMTAQSLFWTGVQLLLLAGLHWLIVLDGAWPSAPPQIHVPSALGLVALLLLANAAREVLHAKVLRALRAAVIDSDIIRAQELAAGRWLLAQSPPKRVVYNPMAAAAEVQDVHEGQLPALRHAYRVDNDAR